ncbi:hypothetical protein [Streptomyces sp. NBC_00063]|uniref:hypothetical protein n=1 Tax=Streptomyces sp. NBC_00063 TaxID=2975638 RepID=UPI003D71C42E
MVILSSIRRHAPQDYSRSEERVEPLALALSGHERAPRWAGVDPVQVNVGGSMKSIGHFIPEETPEELAAC